LALCPKCAQVWDTATRAAEYKFGTETPTSDDQVRAMFRAVRYLVKHIQPPLEAGFVRTEQHQLVKELDAIIKLGGSDMNYAVMKTVFGDYWVGKTNLEPNGVGVFASWDEAVDTALDLSSFNEDNHYEIEEALEEEAEEVRMDMQKWIVT